MRVRGINGKYGSHLMPLRLARAIPDPDLVVDLRGDIYEPPNDDDLHIGNRDASLNCKPPVECIPDALERIVRGCGDHRVPKLINR